MKNKSIIIVLVAAMLICAVVIIIKNISVPEKRTAKIYMDGELIREINLDAVEEPFEFDVTDGEHINTVRAERGRIRIISADCPDKICVNQGWIDNGVLPIVCLPNKVIVEISGGDIDAAS